MRAITLLLISLALIAAVNCYAFTATGTVQVGSNSAWPATIKVDTASNVQKIQIAYNFGVTELEIYPQNSRYQICPSGCKNYFLTNPLPDFGYRSGGVSAPNNQMKYTYTTSDGYTTSIWTNQSGAIVKVVQSGNGYSRTYVFNTFTTGTPTFTSPPANCASVQCGQALDLMLVIDSSGSISDSDYIIEMQYAQQVIDSFTIGTYGVHAGLVTFATSTLLRAPLTGTKATLTNAISSAQQQGGETNIGDAILLAAQQFASNGRGGNVPKVIILLTDGKANRPDPNPISYMITQANNAKASGILIYAIGVGSLVQQTDLNDIASSPVSQYTSLVGNFAELQNTISAILAQVCVGGEVDGCNPSCYSDTQFCGCGQCLCVGSDAVSCGDRGTFNAQACSCTCENGWTQTSGGTQTHSCMKCPVTSCQNSGTIVNDPANGICGCDCKPNYSGPSCETCTFTCQPPATVASCGTCKCGDGTFFTPESNCQVCDPNACGEHGTPNINCDGCDCDPNYSEDFCTKCNWNCVHGQVNEGCQSCSCNEPWDGGHCDHCNIVCRQTATIDTNLCKCNCALPKYAGDACERCSSNYCVHGRMNNNYPTCSCACDRNWGGANCNTCTITCASGTVHNTNGDCYCACDTGYTGEYCNQCDTSYCHHGGRQGTFADGTCDLCTCIPYWSGNQCDNCLLSNSANTPHCGSGSRANDACTACICPTIDGRRLNQGGIPITQGTYCDTCSTALCLHGGTPTNFPDCTCNCPENFAGRRCEYCVSNLCSHGGIPADTSTCTSCVCDTHQNWSGTFCNECHLTCEHGTLNTADCICDCDQFWIGDTCGDCHNIDPTLCDECSYNGILNEACTACICDEYHTGEICDECKYDCGLHGERSEDCRTCECYDGWIGADCTVCDTSVNSIYCSGRGTIVNSETDCNVCVCRNSWAGDDCSECPIDCNDNGRTNNDCTGCVCDNSWNESDNCLTCGLDCHSNGHPNADCTACICDDGYTGTLCDYCNPNYVNSCVHDSGVLTDDCACDCVDQWTGRSCNECDLTVDNCQYGDIIDYAINGEMQCRCRCHDNWVGDECNYCGFLLTDNSLYQCPDDISEPVLTDCSCHCPEYYRDIEGCDECIITLDDCVHVKPNTVPNLTRGVCACICDGNWSGRNCSICDPNLVICQTGWELNTDNCECEEVCGDGLIVGDEQCEVSLMAAADTVCCQDCFFDERRPCDDLRSCTRYDFCEVSGSKIYCNGTDQIDYTVDADRRSIPLGPLTANYWAKWGVSVTSSVPVSIADPRTLGYPSSNPCGGDIVFDRVIVAPGGQTNANLCFNFDEPTEVQSISVINNSKEPGASNSFHVSFYCPNTFSPISVDARNYGPGSVEFIRNPCSGFLVTKICYSNFPTGAIGPVFFCDDNNYNLGRLGDYVWYDINVDTIQDPNELPVPNVPVKLYEGTFNRLLAITTTNQDGLYIFEYLYNGNYSVEFNIPSGYTFSTPVRYPYSNLFHYGTLDKNYITDTVKEILTVDVGIYLFGAIGDYIFYDVSEDGIQNEASSYAVSGVTLKLYEASDLTTPLRTQVTDAFGNYLFAPLPVYKTATTYHEYVVIMTPPAGSTVTYRFSGNDRAIDSNFDRATYQSDVVYLTPQKPFDLTIDGGIYYCCGSVGDRVWYDDKTTNGIQDDNEQGVPNVRVTLYHNNVAIGSQYTNATGYYLFTGLQLSGTYYVHFDRVQNYVLTEKSKGTNREIDSDANANGDTDVFYLTRERPDRRDIDAGIKNGCLTASECTTSDLCQTGVCNAQGQCEFTPTVRCDPLSDPCVEPVCQPATGLCVAVPKISTSVIPCQDNNVCTTGDICVNGKCKGTPADGVGHPCDDASLCTRDDHCVAGVCTGTPCTENPDPCFTTVCDVTGCKDIPSPGTPCSDNNFCTENDACDASGHCAGTPKVCQNNEYCKTRTCDPRNGECKLEITPNAPCSDGSSCTENDTCDALGRCKGTPITCTGNNPCLNYFCQGGVCTTSVKSTTTPCNDNNACTSNDRCQPDATCAGTPLTCDDGKTCTTDSCQAGTCVHTISASATCTDNNPCTNDVCHSTTGACISTPINCDDGKECTTDRCENGQCFHYPTTSSCNDQNPCTVFDACDSTGTCKGAAKNCDDNNECTDDRCNPVTGACEHINNSNPCDDGTECSGASYCTAGVCTGYDVVQCVSTNPCTIAYCIPETGSCHEESKVDNTVCQTDDLCKLNGVCLQGECQGRETACDDNNPCTVDSCFAGNCIFTHSATTNNVPCNDGNACTENDVCIFDARFSHSNCHGVEKHCDDGNVCTDDFCNILTGECDVENVDSTVTCDDGVNCTLNDVCVEGECQGTERVCTPAGTCKANVCNEATGLCEESVTVNQPCDDGLICTEDDTCDAQGNCNGSNKCEDLTHPNPCKDYQCSDTGDCIIVNVADNSPCNDGNACTLTDVCIRGRCTGTNPFTCAESDTCNRRECVDTNGTPTCRTTFTQATCGTSTECHKFICSSGTCATITSKDCNAGNTNPCTRRVCGVDGTCTEENISGPCEDGNACTDNTCSNGECIVTSTRQPCGDIQCTAELPCPATAPPCFHYNCVNHQCVLSENTCTASTNPCVRVECNRETGQCVPHKLENTSCNDGNSCTSNDICVSTGSGAEDVVCRGADVPCASLRCKQGTCNPATGQCSYTITAGATCNDGVACTEDDVCDAQANCRGTQISCDDGNTCTNDACVNGQCVHQNNDIVCSDGNLCTSNDRCVAGTCTGQAQTTCPESVDPCLLTVCHPTEGCVSVPVEDEVPCGSNEDNDCLTGESVCRGGVCIPPERLTCDEPVDPQCPLVCIDNECQYSDSFCDDGNACTVQDRCRSNGECIGVSLDCSDLDNGCVEGYCREGACVTRPVSGATDCDDGDFCTNNFCENGECKSTPVTCSSNNPCERFTCDPKRGCVASNNPVSCTPVGIYNHCFDHICVDRACTEVPPALACDDNNPCTEDLCAPETGQCIHRNSDLLQCSDNNACTTDVCQAGVCRSTPINCDDNNPCTTDTCVGGVCVRTDNNNVCELSHGCITSGICSNRNCVPATFSTCSTANLQQCQQVSCDRVSGECVVTTITDSTTSCNDNDGCTENDVCTPTGCHGSPKVCPSSTIECTESYCDAGICKSRPNDDLECHSADTTCGTSMCENGECVENPTGLRDCSDDDACTFDNRCTENGCESTPYSCILSPCVYSACTDDGFCRFDRTVNTWNPLTYIAFRTQTNNATAPEIRYYVVAVSSLTGDIRGFVRVSKSVTSLIVKPYVGELYALVNNDTVNQLYRIPVNASAVNVLADGTFEGWRFITTIPSTIQQPDLTYKPSFVATNQPYSYTLNARSKSTNKFYTINTATNPAGTSQTVSVSGLQGATWDNHGRFIYGIAQGSGLLKAYSVSEDVTYDLCSDVAIPNTGTFIDMATRYDESIIGATQNDTKINIFSVRFDKDADGIATCNTVISSLNKTSFVNPSGRESFISITAIAFDDTICTVAVGAPNSNGGNVTHHGGGGTPNNGGGGSPPPPVTPPPDQVTHVQGGSNPGSHTPGTTDNNVLTGGTGSVATAVVSVVGTSAVAAFAIFAVVLGLNNTKKDPPANLTAALVSTETSAIASDNPLFQGANDAGTNILA